MPPMKTYSTFALGAALGLLISLAPACGPAKEPCTSSNCSGCCDSTGFCQFGFDNAGCGTSGGICQACGLGTTCQTGLCLPNNSSGGGSGGGTGGGAMGGGSGGGVTGGGTGGGVTGGGTGGGVTGGGAGGGVTGGGTGGGGTGGGTGGGAVGGGTGGGGTGGGTVGGGTGGGGLPSFTSQLWYFGRVTSTARLEVGRVLFPSRTLAPLTVPGTDLRGWSVNAAGRLVALSADTTLTGRFDLVVVNHDGTGLRTVAMPPVGHAVSFIRFSPNGQRIMYETRDVVTTLQRLFVVNTAGGTPLEITPPRASPTDATLNIINSTWSRDSRYLAVVAESTVDRLNELWVVDFSLTSPAPVNIVSYAMSGGPGTSSFWGVVSPVEWSSTTRNELIFKYRTTTTTAFRLMQISPSGANFVAVPGAPDGITGGWTGSFGVSPDGLNVSFSADPVTQNAYEVYRVGLLTGPPATRISAGTAVVGNRTDFARGLLFNSTASAIAFGANYDQLAPLNPPAFDPYVLALPNGPQVRIAAFGVGGYVDDFVWSPDGTQLAFVADWRTDETFELALATSLTGLATPTPLVTPVAQGDVLDVQWTP